MKDHYGFTGGLDGYKTGEYAPYYSTYAYELVFHVATLIPNIGGVAKKKELIDSNKLIISWVDDIETYDSSNQLGHEVPVNIIIIPLESGLYRIRIVKKKGVSISLFRLFLLRFEGRFLWTSFE